MTPKDAATTAGAGIGVGFGPALLEWLGSLFVYLTGVDGMPAMPGEVMVVLGGALGGWLTRVYWSRQPIQTQMFPTERDQGE